MPNILQRAMTAAQQQFVNLTGWNGLSGPQGGVPAVDEDIKYRSEVTPSDLKEQPPALTEDERRIVIEIEREYDRAAEKRARAARHWELCRRYEEGEQWLVIDEHRGVIDPRDEEDIARWYQVNLIAPYVEKVVALLTQNRPDATAAARTKSELDKAAAQEAAAILGYCYRKFGDTKRMGVIAREFLRTTRCFVKQTWDDQALALMPVYDMNGQIVRSFLAPVGDIHEEIVPGDELFFDPSGRTEEECQWVIHARIKPLSWIQETYGKVGYSVKPDGLDSVTGGRRGGLGGFFGDFSIKGGTYHRPNAAIVKEYWEKKSPRFPKGRLIVTAGGRLLHYGPNPYERNDVLPFTGVGFKRDRNSPYDYNLVGELIDLQATINREWGRILARLDKDKRTILVEQLSQVGADAFEDQRDLSKVYYSKGSREPKYIAQPAINAQHFQMIEMSRAKMMEICGLSDVSQGNVPPGVTAGVAIEMLLQSSQSHLQPVTNSIEDFAVRIAEWRIALFGQFASPGRLLDLDDTGTQTIDEVMAFQALQSGGQTRVIVTPGSAIPKSRAGQNQEIDDMFKNGQLGNPADPRVVRLAAELRNFAGTSRIMAVADQLIAEQDAQMQQQAAIQQQAMQMEAAQAQGEQQADVDKQAMQAAADSDKVAMQIQGNAQLAELKHQNDMQKMLTQSFLNRVTQAEQAKQQKTQGGAAKRPASKA